MSSETVEEQIKNMIVERLFLEVSPEEIGDEDLLTEKYDVDSVRLFEMVIGIEELFGIVIGESDFDVEVFRSVRSIAEYIKGRQGDKTEGQ